MINQLNNTIDKGASTQTPSSTENTSDSPPKYPKNLTPSTAPKTHATNISSSTKTGSSESTNSSSNSGVSGTNPRSSNKISLVNLLSLKEISNLPPFMTHPSHLMSKHSCCWGRSSLWRRRGKRCRKTWFLRTGYFITALRTKNFLMNTMRVSWVWWTSCRRSPTSITCREKSNKNRSMRRQSGK